MKTMIALSFLFASLSSAQAFAGDNVTVQVNGKSYSCSEGGAGGGCECKLSTNSWGRHIYTVTYNGSPIYTSGEHYSAPDALAGCKRYITESSACK